MCNLYRQCSGPQAILDAANAMRSTVGNLAPGDVYPDYPAPIVRWEGAERILASARWGMPSPAKVLEGRRTDPGVTNVRNTGSPHWRRWLAPAHRCLVPLTSFAEHARGGNQWFAPAEEDRPMFFAGLEVRGWRSVRKVKDGETTDDLFAFLTCPPNAEVAAVHPKAMPVILTTPDEIETWMTADWAQAPR